MPYFSICISTYKDKEYLSSCLESVLFQDFSDFEVVVVDDGSNDGTAVLLEEYQKRDNRVRPIIKDVNEGVHLGRMAAVRAALGDYIIFLDSDDLLLEGCLSEVARELRSHPADYFHFGADVVADCQANDAMALGTSEQANAHLDIKTAKEILFYCYDQAGGHQVDWRVWQRAYRSDLAKRAFGLMSSEKMGRGQDAYEHFVLASLATHPHFNNDICGYRYFLGRGITSSSDLTLEDWSKVLFSYLNCSNLCYEYASGLEAKEVLAAAEGLRLKLLEGLMNDWRVRLDPAGQIAAAGLASTHFGNVETSAQIMRIVRDDAYSMLVNGRALNSSSELLAWYNLALEIGGDEAMRSPYFLGFYSDAKLHLDNLKRSLAIQDYADQQVRIFVSTHKSVDLFDSKILQPVQVGSALRKERFAWALHDDEGQNISSLNPMYCELTTQYWAWKNVDAPYIGFCHYRRYFDFSDVRHEENSYGEVMHSRIDKESQIKYGLDDATIISSLKDVDIVTTVQQDIRSYLGFGATLYSQYDAADQLYLEDLDRIVAILVAKHPEYREDADKFLRGHIGCFCNMFIMKNELFQEYCSWLFPLLEEFVEATDMSRYSREGLRTPGHLAERLLNIYLMHLERCNPNLRIKHLQCVHFEQPEYHPELISSTLPGDSRPVIPVVYAADNNYVPMLTTTMYSTFENASADYQYDVTVLHRDISVDNQRSMSQFFSLFKNVKINFYNVSDIISHYELTTNNPHISVETYYRFLIQEILPNYDKVLYLDSDLIVEGDIARLFNTDLGDTWLAAVRDIDFVGNVNMKNGDRLRYAKSILKMDDPYDYFQAGVLVLNTRKLRDAYSMDEWLKFASDDRYIYNDQDVLNAYCEKHVTFLDYSWNVMINCCCRIENVFSYAPHHMFDEFLASRNAEKIIHYAGVEKPWKQPECDRADGYWKYARQTPFYERLLMQGGGMSQAGQLNAIRHARAISKDSGLRKFIDPIAPIGTKRRELAKSVVRKIKGLD